MAEMRLQMAEINAVSISYCARNHSNKTRVIRVEPSQAKVRAVGVSFAIDFVPDARATPRDRESDHGTMAASPHHGGQSARGARGAGGNIARPTGPEAATASPRRPRWPVAIDIFAQYSPTRKRIALQAQRTLKYKRSH